MYRYIGGIILIDTGHFNPFNLLLNFSTNFELTRNLFTNTTIRILDLKIIVNNNNSLVTLIYDKRNDFQLTLNYFTRFKLSDYRNIILNHTFRIKLLYIFHLKNKTIINLFMMHYTVVLIEISSIF